MPQGHVEAEEEVHHDGDCAKLTTTSGRLDRIHLVLPVGVIDTTLPIQPGATKPQAGTVRYTIQVLRLYTITTVYCSRKLSASLRACEAKENRGASSP